MRKYSTWLLPIAWMGIIYYSSATPYEEQDIKPMMENTIDLSFLTPFLDWIVFTYHQSEVSVEALGINGFLEFFIRKGAHVGAFFLLMCFFVIAFQKSTKLVLSSTIIVSFLLTVAYAVVDEYHQGFTANRTPYIGDVVLDGVGALLGVIFILLVIRYQNR
ncbi:VanZ family protein [Oceanobacillus halotolerans]|uniref:VanZ family protein n=1 Tax=Oceanobacillus halotolerans TaxID=2663380 RepID=UPI0013D99FF6|nr:VanZ family protein [Oceanobacillus halotolerans]